MPMAKGIVDRVTTYAIKTIIKNQLFQHHTKLDPLFTSAFNFNMEPFQSGWTKFKSSGNYIMYGISYKHLYEKELIEKFESGIVSSSNKMGAGKMRENLMNLYPHQSYIPLEMEIKQFIGKLRQSAKKEQSSSDKKHNRGRKSGPNMSLWYASLKQIVHTNPTEKPEAFFIPRFRVSRMIYQWEKVHTESMKTRLSRQLQDSKQILKRIHRELLSFGDWVIMEHSYKLNI